MDQQTLSSRQTQILKALIDEYIATAEPVGSLALEKKYSLGVSPATVRNEMASLTKKGYLRQPHTSSGRIPSPKAMKFYINQLMEEREVSITDEVKTKESVKNAQEDLTKVMDYATRTLAGQTGCLAIATTNTGDVWSHGYANIFDSPEFYDHEVSQSLFAMLEQATMLQELFFKRLTGVSPIEVLFGEELGWDFFEPVGIVAARFKLGNEEGGLGVIGPYRLNYGAVIPLVRHFGELIRSTYEEDEWRERT